MAKRLIILALVALSFLPRLTLAVNDVEINGVVDFELLTADTALATTVLASGGGQVTEFDVQADYIDITLDNLSTVTFNTTVGGQYLKITPQAGTDYTISPNCPTSQVTMTGTGATAVLRLEVQTTNDCSGGGGSHQSQFPSNYSVMINNGDATTNSTQVTLKLQAVNATQVLISNSPGFQGAVWEPFNASPTDKAWTLESGAGQKTVYVIYKSVTGDVSTIVYSSIELLAGYITTPSEPPAEEQPTPPSGTSPTPLPKQINLGSGECIFDCNKMSYDLYIINPDGTERHINTDFVKSETTAAGVTIYKFEDKSDNFDFNDVLVKVDRSNCSIISVNVIEVNAGWHHQIKIKLLYDGIVKNDVLLWSDSHSAVGTSKIINTNDYPALCSIEQIIIHSNDLIKGSRDTVYYYGYDGKRHIFPNPKTYFSWYENFDRIIIVGDSGLSQIPLGDNVTYKPGSKMLKITSDPKVYAISAGSVLRWIESEAIAKSLYGDNWQGLVDDIPDVFMEDYTTGVSIMSAGDFIPALVSGQITSIYLNQGF